MLRLPGHLFMYICSVPRTLSGRDLASLEECARHFRMRCGSLSSGEPATLAECAAEATVVAANRSGRRITRRPEESWKFVLFVLQRHLFPPVLIAAGFHHSLAAVVSTKDAGAEEPFLVACGSDAYFQLGRGESSEVVERDCGEARTNREFCSSTVPVSRLTGVPLQDPADIRRVTGTHCDGYRPF